MEGFREDESSRKGEVHEVKCSAVKFSEVKCSAVKFSEVKCSSVKFSDSTRRQGRVQVKRAAADLQCFAHSAASGRFAVTIELHCQAHRLRRRNQMLYSFRKHVSLIWG